MFNGEFTSALNQYFMTQNAPFFLTARLLFQHTQTYVIWQKVLCTQHKWNLSHFVVFLSKTICRGIRKLFSFLRQYSFLLSTLRILFCILFFADSLINLRLQVASATCLKLYCWHKIAKCGFIIHLLMRKANTGWETLVFSSLCIS